MDKQLSDLKLERKECEKCGAIWINGEHRWRGTGKTSNNSELDLAGLVCNKYADEKCINPVRGQDGGQTWEYRKGLVDGMLKERTSMLEMFSNKDI